MVCKTCGGKLNDNDKFCRYCGTTVPVAPQQPPVQAPAPQAPVFTPYAPVNRVPPAAGSVPQPGYNPAPQGAYTPAAPVQNNPYAYAPVQPPRAPQAPQAQAPQAPQAQAPQAPQVPGQRNFTPGQNAYVPQPPKAGKKGAHLKAPKEKKPGRKPGKGLIIGGCIAAAVVLIALVVVLIISGSPTVKVASAFKNSADALGKIGDVWHLDDAAKLAEKENYSFSLDGRLNSINENYINDAEVFSGLGAKVDMDVNLENREIGMMASAYLGKTELLTAMVSLEDEMLYLGAPDFLDDFYGINTETVMASLDDLGLGLGEAAQISINVFDVIEIVEKYTDNSEEAREELTEAVAQLAKEISVEKDGKKTLKIGGESVKCAVYNVVIPQDALEDLLDVVVDLADQDPMEMMEEVLESMSLPREIIEELIAELSYSMEEPDYDDLYEALDVLEDLELQVYVGGGKVAGVVYEKKIDGSKLEIGAYVGGDRYGDCIKLELKIDGEKLTVEFEGDHQAREGVFTDEMTIKLPYDESYKLETEYDPKSGELNITFDLDYMAFELEGVYTASDSSMLLDLDELRILEDDEELLSLGLSLELKEYAKRVEVSGARMLTDLTEDDITALMDELEGNAVEWAMELMSSNPELLEYLGIF